MCGAFTAFHEVSQLVPVTLICAKFHTMFVCYFFVFAVICYVHVSNAYCLLCFINFNYSCIVLYGLDCMLQSSFDLDEFNIQSGFYG
jgi:hypothetical protein